MNIFYLSRDVTECARYHCDKHVVKMILEYAQLLSTAHRVLDGDFAASRLGCYKATHVNHPSAVWVRASRDHYDWLVSLFDALCREYTHRYGKHHKCESMHGLLNVPENIPEAGWTDPPQCMPDEYKQDDTVQAYRDYIVGAKSHFAKWDRGVTTTPPWESVA